MENTTYIPNADGAITVEDRSLFKLLTTHKAMDSFLKVLDEMVSGNKEIFRKEAARRLDSAAPGASRVEFLDGKGGCVMVSSPDPTKGGNRKALDKKLLQAVSSVLDLAGKLEQIVKATVGGPLLALLTGLPKGEPVYVLTGQMVPWLEALFATNKMEMPPEAKKVTIGEEDITLKEETKLTAAGFTELQSQLQQMHREAPEKLGNKALYEALVALVDGGISAATVNVR